MELKENMTCENPNYRPFTIDECLSSLETLFKAYQNDSEFNYQLTVKNSPFNRLKELIKQKEWEQAADESLKQMYFDSMRKSEKAFEIIKRDPEVIIDTINLYDDWETYDEDCEYENVTTYPFKSKEEFDLIKEFIK